MQWSERPGEFQNSCTRQLLLPIISHVPRMTHSDWLASCGKERNHIMVWNRVLKTPEWLFSYNCTYRRLWDSSFKFHTKWIWLGLISGANSLLYPGTYPGLYISIYSLKLRRLVAVADLAPAPLTKMIRELPHSTD